VSIQKLRLIEVLELMAATTWSMTSRADRPTLAAFCRSMSRIRYGASSAGRRDVAAPRTPRPGTRISRAEVHRLIGRASGDLDIDRRRRAVMSAVETMPPCRKLDPQVVERSSSAAACRNLNRVISGRLRPRLGQLHANDSVLLAGRWRVRRRPVGVQADL